MEDKALSELCRNSIANLMKHNLVKAWQSDFDQVTYYSLDERECLLRLSMPRYLVKLRLQLAPIHQSIMETVFLHGSLLKSEIVSLLEAEHG